MLIHKVDIVSIFVIIVIFGIIDTSLNTYVGQLILVLIRNSRILLFTKFGVYIMALILVADDSSLFRKIYKRALTGMGHTVITVDDGYACLLAAKERQPDLILMDVVMPVMNGFQATRKLSKNPDTNHIPVIVTSTKNTEPDAIWALRQGAAAYLIKPVKSELLVETVGNILASSDDRIDSTPDCLQIASMPKIGPTALAVNG